jgi:hypothetical protein
MNHLTKEGVILKLTPYGVSSWQGVSRLIREQGLPTKYLTPRKPFFEEEEIDKWLARRASGIVFSNTLHAKILRAQRKKRKGGKTLQNGEKPLSAKTAQPNPFKKVE